MCGWRVGGGLGSLLYRGRSLVVNWGASSSNAGRHEGLGSSCVGGLLNLASVTLDSARSNAVEEGIFNVDIELGRGLEEARVELSSQSPSIISGNDSLSVSIALIADNDHAEALVVLLDSLDLLVVSTNARE